jgi:DNA-binding HxlR family transcriptional regulator
MEAAMPSQPAYGCPVDVPVSVVGGKWKLVILFYLLQQPRRTGELRRLIPAITQKMLTQQLRELEADGLVSRTVYDRVPPKVVYDVQRAERARLDELLQALCGWGLYWAGRTGARILAFEGGADVTGPGEEPGRR